jgi:hypothetical protein
MHMKLSLSTLALALAACSIARAAPVKPCDLLTQEAASRLLGAPAEPPVDQGVLCRFSHSADSEVAVAVVEAGRNGAQLFTAVVQPGEGETAEPVPGLGELSSFIHSATHSSLAVLFHGRILTLGVRNSANPELKAALVQTAKDMLARL